MVAGLARLFRGTVIDSASRTELRVLTDAVIGVSGDGKVSFVEGGHTEPLSTESSLQLRDPESTALPLSDVEIVSLPPRGFLVPGLIDTHTHAPQIVNAGKGYDLQLLDWLEKYTFPCEERFSDAEYAKAVCTTAVRRTLQNGTTTCVYFGTIHTEAALTLGRTAAAHGQRAFVGKVNMDRNSPGNYCEETAESIRETERFVKLMLDDADSAGRHPAVPAPVPVITPRFVPTCSSELMRSLAEIAALHQLPIQTHVSENRGEIDWVHSLHPDESSYTGVYDAHGLLTSRTLLAHGVYLTAPERTLLAERGSTVSHCPTSNAMLRSGMLNVRRLLDYGVHVSLGTDVSGGASPSMLVAIRDALKISNMVSIAASTDDKPSPPLTFAETFWMATVGGAYSLGVAGLTGNFAAGSDFDALIIDPQVEAGPIDLFVTDDELDAFQKWLQLGDDRNVAAVYVRGHKVL